MEEKEILSAESPETNERAEGIESNDNYESYDNNEAGKGSENSENPDNPDNTDGSEDTDDPDNPESPDDLENPDDSDRSDLADNSTGPDKTDMPVLRMVMSACVGLIDGRVSEDEIRRLLDALKAQEEIALLNQKLIEAESRLNEETARLKAEMEQKTAEAYSAGEIAGRNAVITETLAGVSMTEKLPRLSGTPAPAMQTARSIFDLARGAR